VILDLFAGAGGWDVGARELGLDPLGIETDAAACRTRAAAGLRTMAADVAELDPRAFVDVEGLIASPPCPPFSTAGKRGGVQDLDLIRVALAALVRGDDRRAELRESCVDARSMLVLEPLRYALALRPAWLAFEQVPPVIGLWREFVHVLRGAGYHAGAWLLNAADYGVPQTRTRAFLLARLDRPVRPPTPTHADPRRSMPMFAQPWVSMADALGWNVFDRLGFDRNVQPHRGRRGGQPGGNSAPCVQPALTLRAISRSWTRTRGEDEPAKTVLGNRAPRWVYDRPATTVCSTGSPDVIASPGHKVRTAKNHRQTGGVKITDRDALLLQSFPPDYPVQGSRTKRFEQIGNAVPPQLARVVLAAVAT
jgi:DNA (cytosine-5)-methyltransferase 1